MKQLTSWQGWGPNFFKLSKCPGQLKSEAHYLAHFHNYNSWFIQVSTQSNFHPFPSIPQFNPLPIPLPSPQQRYLLFPVPARRHCLYLFLPCYFTVPVCPSPRQLDRKRTYWVTATAQANVDDFSAPGDSKVPSWYKKGMDFFNLLLSFILNFHFSSPCSGNVCFYLFLLFCWNSFTYLFLLESSNFDFPISLLCIFNCWFFMLPWLFLYVGIYCVLKFLQNLRFSEDCGLFCSVFILI